MHLMQILQLFLVIYFIVQTVFAYDISTLKFILVKNTLEQISQNNIKKHNILVKSIESFNKYFTIDLGLDVRPLKVPLSYILNTKSYNIKIMLNHNKTFMISSPISSCNTIDMLYHKNSLQT